MGLWSFPPSVSDARALRAGDGFHFDADKGCEFVLEEENLGRIPRLNGRFYQGGASRQLRLLPGEHARGARKSARDRRRDGRGGLPALEGRPRGRNPRRAARAPRARQGLRSLEELKRV